MKKIRHVDHGEYGFSFVAMMPENMESGLPLIIQLHGAGERGNGDSDLDIVDVNGFTQKVFTEDAQEKCILVMPQCPEDSFWVAQIPNLKKFIDALIETYAPDQSRIYLTGLSMGGFGTWYMGMAFPNIFAAIAPVCGGGMPWNASVLNMPVWAFHGSIDEVVKPSNSIDMLEELKQTNPNAKLTIYEGVAHDSWVQAYDYPLYHWLLQQKKV